MYVMCVYWYSCKKAGPDPALLRWHLDADQGGPGPNNGRTLWSYRLCHIEALNEPRRRPSQNTVETVDHRRTPILTWPEYSSSLVPSPSAEICALIEKLPLR